MTTRTLGLPPWPKTSAKDRRDRKNRSVSRSILKVAASFLKGNHLDRLDSHHGSSSPPVVKEFVEDFGPHSGQAVASDCPIPGMASDDDELGQASGPMDLGGERGPDPYGTGTLAYCPSGCGTFIWHSKVASRGWYCKRCDKSKQELIPSADDDLEVSRRLGLLQA